VRLAILRAISQAVKSVQVLCRQKTFKIAGSEVLLIVIMNVTPCKSEEVQLAVCSIFV
jgi:hypothetical protein